MITCLTKIKCPMCHKPLNVILQFEGQNDQPTKVIIHNKPEGCGRPFAIVQSLAVETWTSKVDMTITEPEVIDALS